MQQEKQPLGLSVSLSIESCIPYELNFFPCSSVCQHLQEIEVNGVKLNHVPCHNIGSHVLLLLPATTVVEAVLEARSMLS